MFRALFEFFNSNILSVCYDIKTNSLYERENEITLDKYNYKKNDDIKTKINKINNDNDNDNDNDNINIYDNINILFKNYNNNYNDNCHQNLDNINNNNDMNTYTDTDTDTYDIISNEDINEYIS
tara:strand:+ start:127 stop:498 length:372 start_codon:yes stop_codon:yes gene_type:complete